MFFTRVGLLIAILAMAIGVFQVTMGFMIATETIGPYETALARYFPNSSSSGKVIDAGSLKIVFSIVLGILIEIRYALRDQHKSQQFHSEQ